MEGVLIMNINPISITPTSTQTRSHRSLQTANNTKNLSQDCVSFSGAPIINNSMSEKILELVSPKETTLYKLFNITPQELRNEVKELQKTGLKLFGEIDKVNADASKHLPKDPNGSTYWDLFPNGSDFRTIDADYQFWGKERVVITKYGNRKDSTLKDYTIFQINPQTKQFDQITVSDKQFPDIDGNYHMFIVFNKDGVADKVNINDWAEFKL